MDQSARRSNLSICRRQVRSALGLWDWALDVCVGSFSCNPLRIRPRRLMRDTFGPWGVLSTQGV